MFVLTVICLTISLMITPTMQMFQAAGGEDLDKIEAVHRFRRRINKYKGDGPIEYMTKLRTSMITEDGSPKDIANDPTSIWCLMDSGKITITTLS